MKDGPNQAGEMFDRPGRPSDYFPAPFPNPEAAATALGAAPPDMSLLAKARKYERGFPAFVFDALPIPGGMYQELGPDYIYAILNGYEHDDDPNWNAYFPGHKIAMPKPLTDGAVAIRRRHAHHRPAICEGRGELPVLGRRADAGTAQVGGSARDDLPAGARRADVLHQEAHLV